MFEGFLQSSYDIRSPAGGCNIDNSVLVIYVEFHKLFPTTVSVRYILPYQYKSGTSCPQFLRYLDEVIPQKQTQGILAEYIAWLFMPELKLEKILFLDGSGCNGKSVFVDIIETLLGTDNVCHESLSDMCSDNGDRSRANLAGKLLNTCSDVSPNAFPVIFSNVLPAESQSLHVSFLRMWQA